MSELKLESNEKRCSICFRIQPLENFYLGHADGTETRRKDCKNCFKARKRPSRKDLTLEEKLEDISGKIADLTIAIQEIVNGYESVIKTQDKIIQELKNAGVFTETETYPDPSRTDL